ncbi:TPA: hypothetical protein HA225_02945 [Candidatus Micrarchaeota archaeon]|nr:hypothetical protein [Candidatus Micrarchaeota archaeon]HIH30451.1 hypothetical protein [Candidatus Micrarchaeota archaeon]
MDTLHSLSVDGIRIGLDDASSEICFVSHAHSDHTEAFRKNRKIIASEETFVIMGREPQAHHLSMPSLKLHPAGHMLGARQISADTEGGKFAYTGDFALHDSFTAPAAEIIKCDALMIDSTYCLPSYRFPNRASVLRQMRGFVKENEESIIVFGAYIRGKAQELVRFLNDECYLAPVVNAPAAKICSHYEKCGVKLDYVAAGTPEAEEAMRHPFVAIMPSSMVNFQFGSSLSDAYGREVKTAVATGWATVSKFPVDGAFPLSDHADFKDTMRYIYESGASKVICANSNSENAAEYLRSIGINAVAKGMARPAQTTLAEC